MSESRACPQCGAPAPAGIKFCGECGSQMPREQPASSGAPSERAPSAPEPSGPAAQPAPRPLKPHKATMVGVPAVVREGQPSGPSAQPGSSAQPSSAAQPGAAAPAPAPAKNPARAVPAGRTMLGMPAVTGPAATPSPQASPSAPSPAPSAASPQPARRPGPGPTHRTMLGMAGVASRGVSGPSPGVSGTADTVPQQQATPPGQQAPPPAYQPAPASFSGGFESTWGGTSEASVRPGNRVVLWVVLGVVVMLVVVVVAGLFAYRAFFSGPDVEASVVQKDAGGALEVRVADMPPGTKVRFAGQTRALEGGKADFPLAPGVLQVGDNDLRLQVVHADGDVDQAHVTLTLDYRVRPDLSGLTGSSPSIAWVVQARPGSKVTLDGKPLRLDSNGKGRRKIALTDVREATGPNAMLERRVSFRIQPPGGKPASGTIKTRIPYASLQVDRPGHDVITEHREVDIVGEVDASATVTLDGTPVSTDGGKFTAHFPLPETEKYEATLVARQPGHVPCKRVLHIERVKDLALAAKRFHADPDIDYAKIAASPAVYEGRKVDMTGRIYNVEVARGQSVVQMLVRDCADGERCPLWVTYDAVTDLGPGSWARVLGEVTGQQQFRAESGRVMTVPRVHAKLLLPVKQ